jgi:hypothetical protein
MSQIKRLLIFFLFGVLFLFSPKEMLADCGWGGPFLENIEQADLIVRGKILAYYKRTTLSSPPPSLEVEVLEVYRGTLENSTIRIGEDSFFGASLLDFPIGTEWILVLEKLSNGQYGIPGCWDSHLKVETAVVGNLNNRQKSAAYGAKQIMSLDDLKNLLQRTEPSPLLSHYEDVVQTGRQQCIDDLISCGIYAHNFWQEAVYAPDGKLHIPAVRAPNESGQILLYEVTLIPKPATSPFVFKLDLNSVKTHQQ